MTTTTTTTTTTDFDTSIRRSRFEVPRTRGALSGVLLVILGAWAGLVPFIGPYFGFGFTPAPDDAWNWTVQRFYMNVLPGLAALIGGLILVGTANRVAASLAGWLAAAGGGWLVVGPPLSNIVGTDPGTPDPAASATVQSLEWLFYFYAVGVVIVFVAAAAIGRLSVIGVRDVRAAERRIAEEERDEENQRLAEEQRLLEERLRLANEEKLPARRSADAGDAVPPPLAADQAFERPVVTEAPVVAETALVTDEPAEASGDSTQPMPLGAPTAPAGATAVPVEQLEPAEPAADAANRPSDERPQ